MARIVTLRQFLLEGPPPPLGSRARLERDAFINSVTIPEIAVLVEDVAQFVDDPEADLTAFPSQKTTEEVKIPQRALWVISNDPEC